MEISQKKSSAGFGPGPTLAKARQDLGLSRDEVADRLHLAPRQIAALESDDYDSLPGSTYVRGYLRSYAELVGLAPGPILEAFSHMPTSAKPSNFSKIAPKEEITSRHRHVQVATYFVVAVILALAVTWWQGREPGPATTKAPSAPAAGTAPAVTVPGNQTATAESTPAPGTQFETARMRADQSSAMAVAPSPAPALSPAASPPPAAPAPRVSAPPQAHTVPVASGSAAVTAGSPRPTAPPVVRRAPASSLLGPPAASGPRARLVLQTTQDSWVDIRDANDNKLIYETVPAGRVVSLDGNEPLSVFLGNAAGVTLTFNGKPFDAGPYKRGMVARFTLGAAGNGR